MTTEQLNQLAKSIYKQNHHWWHDLKTGRKLKRNKGELLMLVITELAEAVEGIRKDLMDDKLPHRKMEEVELADAKIRLLDYAGGFKLKLATTQSCRRMVKNRAECILGICKDVMDVIGTSYPDYLDVSFAIASIDAYGRKFKLDIDGAMMEKLEYNKHRADHKPHNRLKKNGKKF